MVVDFTPVSIVKMLKTYEVPGELFSDGMIFMWLGETSCSDLLMFACCPFQGVSSMCILIWYTP